MLFTRLQRTTVALFSSVRRMLAQTRTWIQEHPTVKAWLYPKVNDTSDSDYRSFNAWYFTSFYEQERMLADRPRMDFYHAAIQRKINPGDRVIDLGTGTGILAAFASRRGAGRVFAIDHSRVLKHAKALAKANRIERVIFVSSHSTAFKIPEKVDVIVHEQMGDCLFDESMVANVADLRDRLLKPGGLILPSCFDFYCEPIQTNDRFHVPFIWELNVHGFDYSSLERKRPQDPGYYILRSTDRSVIDHPLSEPEPVLSVDLHTAVEANLPREIAFSRTVTQAGRLDGFVVYFRARVDQDLTLTTDPLDPGRAPHWGFRILRTDREEFVVGDVIDIQLKVHRWSNVHSWRWIHKKRVTANPLPLETTAGV